MTRNVVLRALMVLTGVFVTLAGLLAAPAQAASTAIIERDGEPVTLTVNGRNLVDTDDVVDDVWVLSGRATIRGRVEGSVIVVNGGVSVTGSVGGDILVVRGGVWVGPEAIVDGDISASKPINVADDAVADGTRTQTSVVSGLGALLSRFRLAIWISLTVALLGLGLIGIRIAGDAVDAARRQLVARPFGSSARGTLLLGLLPLLGLFAIATLVGGLLGTLLLAATALVFIAGLSVTATTIGRAITRGDGNIVGFLIGAVVLRVVALVPYLGDLVTLAAGLVGAGALVLALRNRRAPDPPVPSAADRVDVAPPEEPTTSAGAAAVAPESGNYVDLRPGHATPRWPDDRFAADTIHEDERVPVTAGASWLDSVIARAAGEPTVDLRADEPAIDLGAPTTPITTPRPAPEVHPQPQPRPRLHLFGDLSEPDSSDRVDTVGPTGPPPSDAGPQVIASLSVREDRFADDPAEEPGNDIRGPLFADGPADASHHGVPLFAAASPPAASIDGHTNGNGHPVNGTTRPPLFTESPDGNGQHAGLFGGSDDPSRMPSNGHLDPFTPRADDRAVDAPVDLSARGTQVRDRLFPDGPGRHDQSNETAGGIFADGSRVWRPGRR